jgi:hypothetical protein
MTELGSNPGTIGLIRVREAAPMASAGHFPLMFFSPTACAARHFALVLRGGSVLGKGDEVAGGVSHTDFLRAVEGGVHGHHYRDSFEGGDHGVEIVDFDVEERGTFARVFG